MSISSIRTQIAVLQRLIPGINRAYAQLPRSQVVTADLPMFLNFVRTGTYDYEPLGSDDIYITRTFVMWLLIKPVAEGEEGEGEALVEPWIEIVIAYFAGMPSLGGLTGVQMARLVDDSGPKRMVWPGTPVAPQGVYWGVEFRLDVTEAKHITYASNE